MSIKGPADDKVRAFGHQYSPSRDKVSAFGHGHKHPEPPLAVRKAKNGNRRPMRFVSLHHHSTFSYLDGFQLPEAHVRRAAELQMGALALTEHGNVASHVKLEMAAEGSGVKPIFGVELYCGEIDQERRSQSKNHLTILAADAEGYRNVLSLVSRAWAEGFYYEPTVDGAMLREHRKGLFVLSGCQGSLLFTSLMGGKGIAKEDAGYRRAREVARRFKAVFGPRYFIEVQAFPELEAARIANPLLARLAGELGIPLVATMDCHYTLPDEAEMQLILHNVRGGGKQTLEEQARSWGYDVPLCPPIGDMALLRRLQRTGLTRAQAVAAIQATADIAEACSVTLPKLPMVRFPVSQGRTAFDVWNEWLEDGWYYRGCDLMSAAEQERYRERIAYERSIIEGKDYIDYFLLVADAVRWAKDQGILVGPARGSAAASLLCWLLRITEVNPLLFPSLVFERFIDVSRADLPDIDLDFDSDRRHEVREYLVRKYGEGRVNNIGTFTAYKSRLALDDVARVHRIPKYEVEGVKELLIERSSGDLRASATIEDTIEQFSAAAEIVERHPELRKAMHLEGNMKGFGVHAAGLVVSNGPITEVTAVVQREIKGRPVEVVSMDKYDAERQGLLKLDFLGLSTMAVLAEAGRYLDMKPQDWYDLPLDDEKVLDGFRRNDVVGVFQFDGRATRSVNGALQPDSIFEIADVNALARPGPLHNGAAGEYVDIKRGLSKPATMHPAYDAVAKSTNYQIVYQEQILRLVREIGGFDWTASSYIRRIMTKKIGEQEFNRQWSRFKEGALKLEGMTEELAQKIWGMCITAGAYAFNAAHSVSYGIIAYWTMWLKVYHPAVFYAASLAKLGATSGSGSAAERGGSLAGVKTDRHTNLLRDAGRHHIEVRPPDPVRSGATWQPDGPAAILAGYDQVPGVGEKMAARIVAARPRRWEDLLALRGVGEKTVERIKQFCATPDPFGVYWLDRVMERTLAELPGLGLPRPTHTSLEIPYERTPTDVPITWMGVVLHRNLRDIFESNRAKTGVELKPEEIRDPDLNEWVVMLGEDGSSELVSLRFSRWRYPHFREAIWGIKLGQDLVLVQGHKPGYRNARVIEIQHMWVLDPS